MYSKDVRFGEENILTCCEGYYPQPGNGDKGVVKPGEDCPPDTPEEATNDVLDGQPLGHVGRID